ncbi:TonB-dependent receptor domain-containing protein [Sphingobacterium cellulitidis]|uniref:TonB-dependent receptor domain-containing protein n=1 Tax=Sphingobacterium cellulitidis TaxID=1768011 RepID=UPI003C7CFBA3
MGRIITIMILFLASVVGKALANPRVQDTDIKGKVVNQDNQPVVSASVYLMSSTANVLIKSAVTDENGVYTIIKAPKGSYYIEVSSVGYGKSKSAVFELGDKTYEVEDIKISPSSQAIEAVTVEGRAPLVQNVNGKLVLNVENSTLAAGNNALEVVKRAPGVSVDKDDNLQLMGQQGVTVTIDGRQTYMTGEQLATFLKSTDASQIKSVEVTTTRSAKDDAEGAVGTINIVLKKSKTEGFNGSFIASAAHGKHPRGNTSLNINYKKNNTTLFGSYAYTNNKEENTLNIYREIRNAGNITYFDQKAQILEKNNSHNFRAGIEQKTSENNTMMFQVSGNKYSEDSENTSATTIGKSVSVIDSILRSPAVNDMSLSRVSLNFNNEYKMDTLGQKLTLDLDWSIFNNDANMNYHNRMEFPNGSLVKPETFDRSIMPTDIDIYVGKLDYVKPFKKGNLEAGLKYSKVQSDNNMIYDRLKGDVWENIANRSNHFIYDEQIAAGYMDYSRAFGKWTTKVGIRAEYTKSNSEFVSTGENFERDYLDWFPSANLGYNLSENHIFSLGYAKKITRPNYRFLNPFRYYIDEKTYQLGNPDVKPQYTHGFTLNYTLMQMFNFTLGTDITNDAIVESMGQDSIKNETWVTRENLGRSVTSYLNMNIPFKVGKFWTMNNNITGIYMHFKGPIAGSVVDRGSFFIQANSFHNFRINPQWSFEASVNGNTPFIYNLFKIQGRINTDLGVNYNFKDQKSSLKLAMTDVFRSSRNNLDTDFNEFRSRIRQYNDNQTVRLTFTYKFGNLKQQIRKSDSKNEEKDRVSVN